MRRKRRKKEEKMIFKFWRLQALDIHKVSPWLAEDHLLPVKMPSLWVPVFYCTWSQDTGRLNERPHSIISHQPHLIFKTFPPSTVRF